MMKDTNAPITLLKKALNRIQTHNLRVTGAINFLPTELSKTHRSHSVWVGPSCPVDVLAAFLSIIMSSFIATVGHLKPWNSYT